MPILVGIDGTGSEAIPSQERNLRYFEEFKNSFVSRICRAKTNARYLMGPVLLGGQLPEAIAVGLSFIDRKLKSGGESVLLTGYSRGGLGVLVIAEELRKKNIPVQAMLLFDAVDRHGGYNATHIPYNVRNVHHVVRDPLSSSRESFSNCGMLKSNPSTNYPEPTKYMCTHGGMGGMPWTANGKSENSLIFEGGTDRWTKISYKQDVYVSERIWSDCQSFMKTHSFI